MKKEDLRIIFMGTPDFAVESLRKLVDGGYHVVCVVTMPDKPIGRHQHVLSASAVKQYAVERGLPVLQPERLKDETFLEQLRSYQADLQIVVAFRMLPEVVWSMPRLGTFNLHASLLPQYRGAAPINWAVINGDKETGVTTFFLQHEIDTGNIILQRKTSISADDNAGTVHDRLMKIGGELVTETVDLILQGDVSTHSQSEFLSDEELRPAPKIFKETCRIDWSQPKEKIHDFIRGLSPYPAAWTELLQGDKQFSLKLFRTHLLSDVESSTYIKDFPSRMNEEAKSYPWLTCAGNRLFVQLPDGCLEICELQLAGKKRMPAADFLRGFKWTGLERLC